MRSIDGVVHFHLDAMDSDDRVPVFEYEGAYVAPTIEVSPGDQIQIVYRNAMAPRVVSLRAGTSTRRTCTFTASPRRPTRRKTTRSIRCVPATRRSTRWTSIPVSLPACTGTIRTRTTKPPGKSEAACRARSSSMGFRTRCPSWRACANACSSFVRPFRRTSVRSESPRDASFAASSAYRPRSEPLSSPKPAFEPRTVADQSALSVNRLPAGSVKVGIAPGEREFFRVLNATGSRNLDLSIAAGQLARARRRRRRTAGRFPGRSALASRTPHRHPAGRARRVHRNGSRRTRCDAHRRVRHRSEGRHESRCRPRQPRERWRRNEDRPPPAARAPGRRPRTRSIASPCRLRAPNGSCGSKRKPTEPIFASTGSRLRRTLRRCSPRSVGTVERWTSAQSRATRSTTFTSIRCISRWKASTVHRFRKRSAAGSMRSMSPSGTATRDGSATPGKVVDPRRLSRPGHPRHVSLPLPYPRSRGRRHDGEDPLDLDSEAAERRRGGGLASVAPRAIPVRFLDLHVRDDAAEA